jgi:hypothetical protein
MIYRIILSFTIFLLLLAVSCSWSTFPPFESSVGPYKKSIRVSSRHPHSWPESIDRDRDGNLYFSDSIEKALYRLVRQPPSSRTAFCEEKLLEGLDHISGVSIDRDEGEMYLGVRLPGEEHSILRLSLSLWKTCATEPMGIKELKEHLVAGSQASRITAHKLGKTNGIVFDPSERTVFYTVRKKSDSKPSHVGKIQLSNPGATILTRNLSSPNGIDIDPETSLLRVAQTGTLIIEEGGITSLDWHSLIQRGAILPIGRTALGVPRDNPDGLICMEETGDVLIAGFRSGTILFLHRNKRKNRFHAPVPISIDRNLGNPTDMVIGPSSVGPGRSLYVTTTNVWSILFINWAKGGRVIEISDIDRRLEDLRR